MDQMLLDFDIGDSQPAPTRKERSKTAEAARDKAIEQVESNASPTWLSDALSAIQAIAKRKEYFTTDDLWDVLKTPVEPRAMGAVMVRASKSGVCVATNQTQKSARKECHARPLRIWKSLIYRP